jgi:hypothetical protein
MTHKPSKTESITKPGWSCPICGAEYLYDCPNLGPIAFLQAVMHAPNVAIRDRMRAANHLLHLRDKGIYSDDLGEVVTYVIPEVLIPKDKLQ